MTALPEYQERPGLTTFTQASLDLPAYSCTVNRAGPINRKIESVSDETGRITHPFRRKWNDVWVVVRGTKLEIYKPRDEYGALSNNFSRSETTPREVIVFPHSITRAPSRASSAPQVGRNAQLIKCYSLCGAVCGIACDYKKKRNVLRIIVEKDQFLFQTAGAHDTVDWLETIQKAINIAEPLDTRKEPDFHSIPSRRRLRTGRAQGYEIFEAQGPNGHLTIRAPAVRRSATAGSARFPGPPPDTLSSIRSIAREAIRTRSPTRPSHHSHPTTRTSSTTTTAQSRPPHRHSQSTLSQANSTHHTTPPNNQHHEHHHQHHQLQPHTTTPTRRKTDTHVTNPLTTTRSGKRKKVDVFVCAVLNMNHPRTKFRMAPVIPHQVAC